MVNVFEFSDYKKVVAAYLEAAKSDRGYRSRLITATGCQKSFFSQIINGSIHLTPDHASNMAEFWKVDDISAEYFLCLVGFARASSRSLKKRLGKKLEDLRNKSVQPTERFNWPAVEDFEKQSIYYSSWYWSAIHIIVSIPNYTTAKSIADRLSLPLEKVIEVLNWLEKAQFVRRTKNGYAVTENLIYLKGTSPLIESHHANWRSRAIVDVQRGDPQSTHYSAVFAATTDDFFKLKEDLAKFMQTANARIAPSRPGELYAMNLDLFKA